MYSFLLLGLLPLLAAAAPSAASGPSKVELREYVDPPSSGIDGRLERFFFLRRRVESSLAEYASSVRAKRSFLTFFFLPVSGIAASSKLAG